MADDHHLKADALMVTVTLLAAFGWLFSKAALQGLPPLLFLGVRFLLAGLLLGAIGHRQLRRLDAGDWLRAGATGATLGVTLAFWMLALYHAQNVGVGAFISSLGVVLAPIVGRVLFGIAVTTATWLALTVAVVGLTCLSLEGGFRIALSDLLFLVAAFGLAVHFNLNTRFAGRIPVLPLTAVQLGIVGLVGLLLSTLAEPWPAAVTGKTLGWLTASILIATSLRFFLQVQAQSMVPVSRAAIIMTLEPVWTALLAMVWLGERMSGLQLVGCGLIFGALVADRWARVRRRGRVG